MTRRRQWSRVKDEAMRVTVTERDVGYLDPGIGGLLDVFNRMGRLATTSSCIGRIALVEGKVHWGRDGESRIVYKTHSHLTPEELVRVLSRGYQNLWLKATGPIMHMRTNSVECARYLLEKAREHGFKHSGIISYDGSSGVVVELMSASQISTPLVVDGVIVVKLGRRHLEALVRRANGAIEEGRRRLSSLASELSTNPGACG